MITPLTYNNTRGQNAKGALITPQALLIPLECWRNTRIGLGCYCSTISEIHFATLIWETSLLTGYTKFS